MIPKQKSFTAIENEEIASGLRCKRCRGMLPERGASCTCQPAAVKTGTVDPDHPLQQLSRKYSDQIARGTFDADAAMAELADWDGKSR